MAPCRDDVEVRAVAPANHQGGCVIHPSTTPSVSIGGAWQSSIFSRRTRVPAGYSLRTRSTISLLGNAIVCRPFLAPLLKLPLPDRFFSRIFLSFLYFSR